MNEHRTVMKEMVEYEVAKNGGYVNAHSHLDRARTVSRNNIHLANATLQQKWSLVDSIKQNSSFWDYHDRMSYEIEKLLDQGAQAIATFIDVDPIAQDRALRAAEKVRDRYDEIPILLANQTLKGVIDPDARFWFELGAQSVDIIGGLPARDKGREAEHLDIILDTGRRMNKMVHVHVDQNNDPAEKETELLIEKTIANGMEGRVVAIHGISIACQPKSYRQELYEKLNRANIGYIACPSAWADARRTETLAPTHNSYTPVEEMMRHNLTVAIGTDNIEDIMCPLVSGEMADEMHQLMLGLHYYEIVDLAKIATTNGLKVLGLLPQTSLPAAHSNAAPLLNY